MLAYITFTNVISYTDSLKCIWAHVHGFCSYDHEAITCTLSRICLTSL